MLPSPPLSFTWHGLTIHDLTATLDSRSSLARINVPPGARHPLAWSRQSEKLYLILSGQLHFYCAGTVHLLNAGDLHQVAQGEKFAYANNINRAVELVLVHTPRFDAAAEVLEDDLFPRPLIYHIARRAEWQAVANAATYTPASFTQDGFIHLCAADQILGVSARYYQGQPDLVILQVDPLRVLAPIRYEDLTGSGVAYPHIYGELNRDAVERVVDFPPNADGGFALPAQYKS